MNAPSGGALVARPLLCFGVVLAAGVAGFIGTRNGCAFIAFLLAYIPSAIVLSVFGAVFAEKAYSGLPQTHWGRLALTVSILAVTLAVTFGCWVLFDASSRPPGG